jgi:hypothetical protein
MMSATTGSNAAIFGRIKREDSARIDPAITRVDILEVIVDIC